MFVELSLSWVVEGFSSVEVDFVHCKVRGRPALAIASAMKRARRAMILSLDSSRTMASFLSGR